MSTSPSLALGRRDSPRPCMHRPRDFRRCCWTSSDRAGRPVLPRASRTSSAFPAGLSGADLATRSVLQLLKFGARMVAPVAVEKLTTATSADDRHALQLDCGAEIRCRVLLLALGVRWRRLQAEGADRFAGAGIFYACTRVEADLFDAQDVAVVGGGNSAGQAVMFLAECCPARGVHLLVRQTLGPSMSAYLVARIRAAANVVVHEQTEIEAVHGDRNLEAMPLRHNVTGATKPLSCAAVFVFIGAEPAA